MANNSLKIFLGHYLLRTRERNLVLGCSWAPWRRIFFRFLGSPHLRMTVTLHRALIRTSNTEEIDKSDGVVILFAASVSTTRAEISP